MGSAVLQSWSSSAGTNSMMPGLAFILEVPHDPESKDLE